MIEEILKGNEGKTLEFKENTQSLNGIIKTIIAFSNTAGGTIVIGVEDKTKKIVGINDPLSQEERLMSAIHTSIFPVLMPDIEITSYRTKQLMIINVPHSTGPYYLKAVGIEKGTYIRLGSTNRVVDSETLQSLKNFVRNVTFDELPDITGASKDLDWPAIEKLFKPLHKKITPHTAESIGVLTSYGNKQVPTYGGIILFGSDRLKQFPDARLRCARFAGDTKNTSIDQADIDTYLPLALEEALKFIQRNTQLRSEITELRRKDIPEYPPVALREALTNAIVHADYAMKGMHISVAIFDSRIEITNPGGLPFGFTMEKALAGCSRIRNRVIAKTFYQLKLIEQWGSGITRIIKACSDFGLETPKFEELTNHFRVTLYAHKKNIVIMPPWQKQFTTHLKKKKKASTKEAASLWNVTPRTARSRLIKLVESGVISKTGTSLNDPQGNYVLKK